MKIRLSQLRKIIRETVMKEMVAPPPGFTRPKSRDELVSIYSDTYKSLYDRRPGDLSHMSDEDLEADLYALFDEEERASMREVSSKKDKNDKDGDGDADFADIMMARMMASGMSKSDAKRKTRKHDE